MFIHRARSTETFWRFFIPFLVAQGYNHRLVGA
jgi:hypothetical protein